ncbi:hypothetical protein AB7100_21785, partial [Escherichia coli]
SDGNGSHASTLKSPSYTKSVSWQHYPEFMLYTTVGGHELVVRAGALNDYHAGENITIHFDMTKCHFFDAETEIAIR